MPRWPPHFVLLINNNYWENTTVLVSGGREMGLLIRFLPIVDTRLGCGYFSSRMPDAQILLRLLRKPPASALNRITGYVRSRKLVGSTSRSSLRSTTIVPPIYASWGPEGYEQLFRGDSDYFTALPRAVVRVTGSSGSWDFTTDQDGIYLTPDLPAGGYTVQLLNPPPNQLSHFERVGRYGRNSEGFWTQDLYTQWAGTMSGSVRDVGGANANAFVQLLNADGTSAITTETTDGPFQLANLPIGRYVLVLNPSGPSEYSPYPSVYYPAAPHLEQAKVLEITAKEQHLENLNFCVKPLVERTLQLRLLWPNGQPIDGASFCGRTSRKATGERTSPNAARRIQTGLDASPYSATHQSGCTLIDPSMNTKRVRLGTLGLSSLILPSSPRHWISPSRLPIRHTELDFRHMESVAPASAL